MQTMPTNLIDFLIKHSEFLLKLYNNLKMLFNNSNEEIISNLNIIKANEALYKTELTILEFLAKNQIKIFKIDDLKTPLNIKSKELKSALIVLAKKKLIRKNILKNNYTLSDASYKKLRITYNKEDILKRG